MGLGPIASGKWVELVISVLVMGFFFYGLLSFCYIRSRSCGQVSMLRYQACCALSCGEPLEASILSS